MESKTFHKVESLKKRKDFLQLKQDGSRFFVGKWLLVNYSKGSSILQFGITVPNYVGNAVLRNKFKRWNRQFFRDLKKKHPDLCGRYNIIFRKQDRKFFKDLEYSVYEQALLFSFEKIRK